MGCLIVVILITEIAGFAMFGPSMEPSFGLYATSAVMFAVAGLLLSAILNLFTGFSDSGGSGYKILQSLPSNAEVIPVYDYGGSYYEGPATSAGNLRRAIRTKYLNAMPSQQPLHRARAIYPSYESARVADRSYGQPQYAVDGSLIGFRYFHRDAEGNLWSATQNETNKGNWREGYNVADVEPSENNSNGLYGAYDENSPFMDGYGDLPVKAIVRYTGKAVLGEKGLRAHKGKVVQIVHDGSKPGDKPLKWYSSRSRPEDED